MEELINPNEIKLFYPKNLFLEDKDLEVYIGIEGKILRGRLLDDKIEMKILHFKDLKDFKCEGVYSEEGFHKIFLKFQNGEEIVFNSMEDTNDNWKYKFKEHIKAVAKY